MSHTHAKRIGLFMLLAALASLLSGCPHRTDGDIDVDAVQGYANLVEGHLRAMRDALESRDLERATDAHEEARETLAENREALAAYPELSDLEAAVERASRTLCYHAASFALQGYYEKIREKALEAARDQLEVARREHDRCQGQIADRQDYMPLKMNLDTAPQALAKLEQEIARPALLARIAEAKQGLEQSKAAIRAKLEKLASEPNQRDLAVGIDSDLNALQQQFDGQPDFGGEKVWTLYAASLAGEIASMHQRRVALVRRGKIRMILDERLPGARQATAQASKAKNKAAARDLLGQARTIYQQSKEALAVLLKEEPGLAKETFALGKNKRTGRWLLLHLNRSIASVDRLEKNLGRKGAVKQKPPKYKPPKKKKTRRRVRRW